MSNRRKLKGAGSFEPVRLDLALAQLFRDSCSECGSSDLNWFADADALDVLGREAFSEIAAQMAAGERTGSHWWRCLNCGNAGVFGGLEFEWF